MHTVHHKSLMLGIVAGTTLTAATAILMGQGASAPVRSETQYFATGEGDAAHLWVREGASLRCVGHGECTTHGHDHKEGDGHDGHDHAPAPKKP